MTRDRGETRVQREAAFWLSLIEADTPSAVDRARFQQWLEDDPANAAAYEELSALWHDSGTLTHLADLERPRARQRDLGRGWHGWRSRRLAIPAAVLAVAALVLLVVAWPGDAPVPVDGIAGGVHATDVAEIRELALADGSAVTLGPRSRLEVAYTAAERRVALTAGEAFFSVVPDADRPFIVAANGTRIRVLGTRFNVHEGPRGLTVAVAEGRVEIARTPPDGDAEEGAATAGERRQLAAGQKLLAAKGRLAEVARIPRELPGAWRTGRLVYENATLAEVVADANRYSRTPIAIGAPALADLRVFATFRAQDIETMIADIESALPVIAERDDDGGVVLRPDPGRAG
mgnify:CR=1 FL=1